MWKFNAVENLKLVLILATLKTTVSGEKRVLLILKENSANTLQGLWNHVGWTPPVASGSTRSNPYFASGDLNDFRSPDIDLWKENKSSPYELVIGAYNKNGDSLWTVKFNSTGIEEDLEKLFSKETYLGSSPVHIEPSMINIGVSDNGLSLSLVCDESMVWFQVSKDGTTGTTIITSVDDLPHHIQEDWRVGFKLPKGGPLPTNFNSVYDLYISEVIAGDLTTACDVTAGSGIYKSSLINEMKKRNINKVKLVLYEGRTEKLVLEFNTTGKDKMTWLDCNNILYSPYSDLQESDKNHCSVTGVGTRIFHINKNYGGCQVDRGWIMVKDKCETSACTYESCENINILYSEKDTSVVWNNEHSKADALVLYLYDPKINLGSGVKRDIEFSGSFSLPRTLKLNNLNFTSTEGIPLFLDGVSVKIGNSLGCTFEMLYSVDTCSGDFGQTTTKHITTENQLSTFQADGNRISFNTIPFKCIWLFLRSDEMVDPNREYDVQIKLFYPEDRLMKVPFFVIEGIYAYASSTIASTSVMSASESTPGQKSSVVSCYPKSGEICTCKCYAKENHVNWNNMTTQEKNEKIEEEVQKIKKELSVNKQQLSSNLRKKISASDERPSAQYTGGIGVFMLCFAFGIIVIPDGIQLLFYLKTLFDRYV